MHLAGASVLTSDHNPSSWCTPGYCLSSIIVLCDGVTSHSLVALTSHSAECRNDHCYLITSALHVKRKYRSTSSLFLNGTKWMWWRISRRLLYNLPLLFLISCYALAPQAAIPEKMYFCTLMIDCYKKLCYFLSWLSPDCYYLSCCTGDCPLFPNSWVPFPGKAPKTLFIWAVANKAMSGWPKGTRSPLPLPRKLPDVGENQTQKLLRASPPRE